MRAVAYDLSLIIDLLVWSTTLLFAHLKAGYDDLKHGHRCGDVDSTHRQPLVNILYFKLSMNGTFQVQIQQRPGLLLIPIISVHWSRKYNLPDFSEDRSSLRVWYIGRAPLRRAKLRGKCEQPL